MTVLDDPTLERLLDRLHASSDTQTAAIREHRAERDKAHQPAEEQAALTKTFWSDKLYALDRDKAEFCYHLCRAIDARRVVKKLPEEIVQTTFRRPLRSAPARLDCGSDRREGPLGPLQLLPMALEESALENAKAQPKIRFEIRLHGPAEQQNSQGAT
jgi:hypothetical protein